MKTLFLVAIFFFAGAQAWANPALTTTNLITELMMGDQQADIGMLSRFYGPNFSSSITFSTNVDATNLAFSFVSNPGSVYLGQSFELSGSGTFDPNTGTMSLSSSGLLGSTPWLTSGAFFVTSVPTGYQFTGSKGFFPGLVPLPPSRSNGWTIDSSFLNDDGTSVAGGTWSDDCTLETGRWKEDDTYKTVDGGYAVTTTVFGQEEVYMVSTRGESPPNGGMGDDEISFTPSPEPSSSLLLFSGILGVLAIRKR